MAPVVPWRDRNEPRSAADYEERTTAAAKSVLIEIAQILGSFRGKFVVIGGAAPWLLLDNDEMRHVGTLDVDLGLHAEALGGGEYARLVDVLKEHGYIRTRIGANSSSCGGLQQWTTDRRSMSSLTS